MNFKKTLQTIVLTGCLSLTGCEMPKYVPKMVEGTVVREKFVEGYGRGGIFGGSTPAQYTLVIELKNGSKKIFNYYHENAVTLDAKYDVGDSIKWDDNKEKIYDTGSPKLADLH